MILPNNITISALLNNSQFTAFMNIFKYTKKISFYEYLLNFKTQCPKPGGKAITL